MRNSSIVVIVCTVAPFVGFCEPEIPSNLEEAEWIRDALASPNFSSEEKELMRLDLRLCENGYLEELKRFQIDDGVDQFEAWFLARVFITTKVSVCGVRLLPRLEQDHWVVPLAIGQDDKEDPPVRINRVSGELTGEGYPSLADPMGFIQAEYKETLRRSRQTKEELRAEQLKEAAIRKAAIEEELRQNWLKRQRQSK